MGDDKVHKGERSLAKTEFDAALKSVGGRKHGARIAGW